MNIEKLAREAGIAKHGLGWTCWEGQLERFAALVLEEARIECDRISTDRWSLYKGRKPYTGQELERASDFTQGQADGADLCEQAIRALKDKK